MRYGKTQDEEMKLAEKLRRQPGCVNCKHPLDILVEYQDVEIVWKYDKALGKYQKRDDDGIAEKPYHKCDRCKDGCETADWGFIDYKLINF